MSIFNTSSREMLEKDIIRDTLKSIRAVVIIEIPEGTREIIVCDNSRLSARFSSTIQTHRSSFPDDLFLG